MNDRLRILLLNDRIPPENRGGAGIVVWRLAQRLQNAGHEVHVAAATPDAPFTEIRDGIPTYHLHVRYAQRWRAWLSLYNPQVTGALRDLYQRIQPDVINAHNIHADLTYYSLTLAHKMGIPVVFSSHDPMPFAYHKLSHFISTDGSGAQKTEDYRLPFGYNLRQMRFRYNPLRNIIIRHILIRHVQVRTAPSQTLSDAHHANGLPPFITVHNGIDVSRFTASPETVAGLRSRLGLADRKIVLFAGRLAPAKGTLHLARALQLVIEKVPETLWLVLSSVPLDEQLGGAHYATLREHHMCSAGWLSGEEVAAAFQLADIVTSPSLALDPFPTVNLEAMAARTPVVSSGYGGSPEAVIHGETGFIINPYNTRDFAEKLITLLENDALRQEMGNAAYQRVLEHFSLDDQVDKMLALYRQARNQIIDVD